MATERKLSKAEKTMLSKSVGSVQGLVDACKALKKKAAATTSKRAKGGAAKAAAAG